MTSPEEHTPEGCRPIGEILSLVGDKWTIMLLGALGDSRMRFKDLHRSIDGISQRMLTVTVRNLERDGLLVRTVYPTIPPRVEYELSALGRSLKEVLAPIGNWVLTHQDDIEESRRRFNEKSENAKASASYAPDTSHGHYLSNGK